MSNVVVFGSFDILHEGHRYFLQEARGYGDKLFLVLARDETIERLKGRKPVNSLEERKKALLETGLVDEVIEGHESDYYKFLEKVEPDVVCLGYDQEHFVEGLMDRLEGVKVKRVGAYKPEKFKSSLLRKDL